jgi:hypothetical protein
MNKGDNFMKKSKNKAPEMLVPPAPKATNRPRPKGVPEAAYWDDADGEWVFGLVDSNGQKHGPYAYYRPDGTLQNIANNVHGLPHGIAYRVHENGEFSQICEFKNGELVGLRSYIRTKSKTTEVFFDGASPNIKKIVQNYENDSELTFWDWEDNEVDAHGKPLHKTA